MSKMSIEGLRHVTPVEKAINILRYSQNNPGYVLTESDRSLISEVTDFLKSKECPSNVKVPQDIEEILGLSNIEQYKPEVEEG